MLTSYPVKVDYALIAAASVSGTVATVLTTNHIGRELLISNSLDADVILTLDGAEWILLPALQGGGLNTTYAYLPSGTVLGVKSRSGNPSTGVLGLTNV
jgi:hypothetical protein